ncbi:hypothetical protein ANME2D_02790 [Candidatus Methanoperedens nitroreducens]|uniref:Uncharacterized protein n=1 Tax=Candidatus Methanoperedens nitratireducens TaxID=1392998 RepID=A0A062V5S8_9EURY|nr:hypothetical protein ANME2D_02790 [Candidatus Methanoperedens nitroreducens]
MPILEYIGLKVIDVLVLIVSKPLLMYSTYYVYCVVNYFVKCQ